MQCKFSKQVVRQLDCPHNSRLAPQRQPQRVSGPRKASTVKTFAMFTTYESTSQFSRYQQQGNITWQRPDWHPNLLVFRSHSKRGLLQSSVQQYYEEVINNGCTELLRELAAPGVTYSDALGFVEDAFGIAGMQSMVQEFQATHPLLQYHVDDIIIDEDSNTAVAHYTATAAHLLPSRDGAPATGRVSTVQGMDRFKYDRYGHITSIQSYRQRFADEEDEEGELQLIDWDAI